MPLGAGRSLPRAAKWSAALLWVAVASWLQLARVSGSAAAWNSLWAEDGSTFLTDAYHWGLVSNLFRTHAGYYQVIGRLVAQPAAHLPVSWGAAWMGWSAAVVTSCCALIVWNRAGQITNHMLARGALTLLVPFMGQLIMEVSTAVNDLHWYLIYTVFWVFLVPPKSNRGCVASALLAALATLSDPLAGLTLLAAAAGWWLSGRSWRALVAPSALVAALIAQYVVHAAQPTSSVDGGAIPEIYAVRVALSWVTGDHLLGPVYRALGAGAAIIAFVGLAVLAGVLARRAQVSSVRLVAAVCFVLSFAYLAVSLSTRGTVGLLNRHPFSLNGSRYTIVPLWLLSTGLIMLADAAPGGLPLGEASTRRLPLALLVLCAWIGFVTLSDGSEPTVRAAAPAWSVGVRQAEASCRRPLAARDRTAPLVSDVTVGSNDVVIPVAPLPRPGEAPGFAVVVSCDRLQH